jgi:hypothetical protein
MDRTNAERQRRYITRLKAAAAQKPAQHEAAAERIAALEVENAALKAEVARLKAAAADTQQRQSRERPRTDWAALKAQATAARKAKRAEAKAARLAAAAAERPDADVPTLLAENDTLQRQLGGANRDQESQGRTPLFHELARHDLHPRSREKNPRLSAPRLGHRPKTTAVLQ